MLEERASLERMMGDIQCMQTEAKNIEDDLQKIRLEELEVCMSADIALFVGVGSASNE